MKNLIYQFWNGNVPYYAKCSSSMMKSYADYVGAEYRVDYNSSYVKSGSPEYMNCFRPIHDISFHEYDNVLFLDMDIFPVENIKDNIFEVNHNGIAVAQEIGMPEIRYNSTGRISGREDEKWTSNKYRRYLWRRKRLKECLTMYMIHMRNLKKVALVKNYRRS